MVDKIDHIGIAVSNLEEALKFYTEALGLNVGDIEEVEEQKVKVAFLRVGETKIELLQSTDPDGPVGKFIARNGPGLHHIAYRVNDIESVLEKLKNDGVRLIDEQPRIGAGGAKIAFIHPRSSQGALTEICQR